MAKAKVRSKIEQFGDDYFYTLGLNNKFCDGIRKFNANQTRVSRYDPEILGLINSWLRVNCSQSGYENLAEELEKRENNKPLMDEYNIVWESKFSEYFQFTDIRQWGGGILREN